MTAATLTRPVILRPVRAADAEAMQRFVLDLDAASRRLRFHGAVNACTPGLLRQLTVADGVTHVAFVACVDGEMVGEARYFVDAEDPRCAEFAIAVSSSVRGSGTAAELLQALLQAAGKAGLVGLHGDVLEGNERMAAFMRRQGFEIDVFAQTDPGVARWQRDVPRPSSRPAAKVDRAGQAVIASRRGMQALQGWWGRLGQARRGTRVAALPQ